MDFIVLSHQSYTYFEECGGWKQTSPELAYSELTSEVVRVFPPGRKSGLRTMKVLDFCSTCPTTNLQHTNFYEERTFWNLAESANGKRQCSNNDIVKSTICSRQVASSLVEKVEKITFSTMAR